jgi:predicted DNA-binding WGR domain protein
MAGKRYFEFVEGTSSKFWEVWIEGNEVRTRYGKIGAAGQTTIKDEGSPAAAQKLHDKLVNEKTKKGYVEKGGGGGEAAAPASGGGWRAAWEALAAADDVPAALAAHFAFLGDTPRCKPLIRKLAAQARSIEVDGDVLRVVFEGVEGDELTLEAQPPFEGKLTKQVPKSYARFVGVHTGMSLDGPDVPLYFAGVDDDGQLSSGGFEDGFLAEADPDRHMAMFDRDVPIVGPIDLHQDWVVYNFLEKNALNEPTLNWLRAAGSRSTTTTSASPASSCA